MYCLGALIFCVAAIAKKLIDIVLGHRKSRVCCYNTLCFIDHPNLLIFTCEKGQLFAPVRGLIRN